MAPNAAFGGVEHFPSSPRRLCRRHHPKTAPRQLPSKSRFFAPCISQKDSQWRQRRHVKIYKKLFKEGPHQNEILHYVIGVIAYLFITKTRRGKKILQCFYRLRRRRTFFNVCTAFGGAKPCFFNDSPAFCGGKLFSSMILTPSAAPDFFWHDCAAFGGAKIRKRRRINFHKKRSFSNFGILLPRLATLFKNITCAGTNYINVI